MKEQIITQWCPIDKCLVSPYPAKVGKVNHVFCCQQGFERSLKDFTEYMASKQKK